MAKMGYKSTVILWPVLLIALYWSSQTEAVVLVDKHVEEATECLRIYMGEGFAPGYLQGNMLYDEYLGEFCKEEDINKIEKKISNDKKEHGEKVRTCLGDKNLEYVYEDFFKAGDATIAKAAAEEDEARRRRNTGDNDSTLPLLSRSRSDDADEMEVNNAEDDADDVITPNAEAGKKDKPVESRGQSPSQEWSPIQGEIKPIASRDSQPSTSKDQKQPADQPVDVAISKQDRSDDLPGEDQVPLSQMKFSNLTKFSLGLCFDVHHVNFSELKDEKDITKTFNCLENCSTRFFNRIMDFIDEGRNKVIKKLEEKKKSLLEKQNTADGNEEQPAQKETDTDANKQKTAEITLSTTEIKNKIDPNEAISKPSKKIKTVDPDQVDREIENFKIKSDIKKNEFANTFVRALQENMKAEMTPEQILASGEWPIKFKTIDMLTMAAKKILTSYSEYFTIVDKALDEDDKVPDENLELLPADQMQQSDTDDEKEQKKIETMRSKLKNSFFLYTNCAKRRCYMKSRESIPMDEYIHNEANPEDILDSQPVEQQTTPLQKLLKALVGKNSTDDDDDSSSSSSSEEGEGADEE